MIDLHCHLLPGIDDGARDLEQSLDMARAAVEAGIVTVACTPHILPGQYNNTGPQIIAAVEALSDALDDADIPLELVAGADVYVTPTLIADLKSGQALTIANTSFFLLEPPHHILPPGFEEFVFTVLANGYVPIITHPERLRWMDTHHEALRRMHRGGALIQLTGDSLLGKFGKRAKYWSERLLDERLVQLLATDAHDTVRRPTGLVRAIEVAAKRIGDQEALALVTQNPLRILENAPVAEWAFEELPVP